MRPIHVLLIAMVAVIVLSAYNGSFRRQKVTQANADHCDDFNYYMRDYQIQLHMDTVWIYDGDRLVSRFITDYSSIYDSVLLKDNE